MVKTARNYTPEAVELASITALENYSSVHPALFKSIVDKHAELLHQQTELVLSMETESYVREADYFTHHSSS